MQNPYKEFDDYGLRHLPAHLITLEHWESLEEFLTDLYFIEAKCAAGMTYDLTADYTATLEVLPEAQEENRIKREREARVQKYIQDLIAYSKGEIQTLGIIPSVEPWSEEKIKADIERIKNNPTRLDRIRAFAQFVNAESHVLVKFASHSGFVIQQAYNSANSGPVVKSAEATINQTSNIFFLRSSANRLAYNPHPILLKTIETEKELKSVSVTSDLIHAITGNADGTICLWNLESGRCSHILKGHTKEVTSVSITPDGQWAVSGSNDQTLRVWDLERRMCSEILEGHTDRISIVSITPDGRRAMSKGVTRSLVGKYNHRIWDLEHGICLHTLNEYSVSVTPNGRYAVSGNGDGTLRVWDLENGECLHILEGHKDIRDISMLGVVFCESITIDGTQAISSVRDRYSYTWNVAHDLHEFYALRVWDLKTGMCLGMLKGHTKMVTVVSISLDKRRAVSGSLDQTLRMWDLESRECLHILDHQAPVTSISITPDGKYAVSVSDNGTLKVWDLESGKCFRVFEKFSNKVLSINPDGKLAASISGKALQLLELEQGFYDQNFKGHARSVSSVGITPNGQYAVSGSNDKTLRIWDLESGGCLHILEGHTEPIDIVSVNPNSIQAISAGGRYTPPIHNGLLEAYGFAGREWSRVEDFRMGRNDVMLEIWDLENGTCLKTFKESSDSAGHTDIITSMDISYDGIRAVSGSRDKTLRVWDLEGGKCLKLLPGHTDMVSSVHITLDNRCAVSTSNGDKTLRVWDLESGVCLHSLEGGGNISLTLDGRCVMSWASDNTLRLWDLERGICLRTFLYQSDGVRIKISSDARQAVSVGLDRILHVWDLKHGDCFHTFKGHTDKIQSVSLTQDGRYAVSGSSDQTLRIWDLRNGDCMAIYQARGDVTSVSKIHPNGHFVYGTDAGEVMILVISAIGLETLPIVTPVRIWLYTHRQLSRLSGQKSDKGCWDENITTFCQWCGKRFNVAATMLDVISGITRTANLSPDQSPCLELPDEAWDEPKLLSECPLCHQPLKFNPFIVDNREKY